MKHFAKTLIASALLTTTAYADIKEAPFNELGDMLTPTEASGRFDWLEKCYSGMLVEVWERTHDATEVIKDSEKIAQLKALWLSEDKVAAGRVNYLTFANKDFTNPYQWYAGTHANDTCTTMPIEYEPVALKTTLFDYKYCASSSYSNEWEWIESVEVGQQKHDSGTSSYTMVDGRVMNLFQNQTFKFTVKSGSFDPTYTPFMSVRVWIDLNQNGQYESSEMLYHGSGYGPYTFDYLVPKTATQGMTSMRITADNGGGYNDACKRIDYGEVEDYLVYIQ